MRDAVTVLQPGQSPQFQQVVQRAGQAGISAVPQRHFPLDLLEEGLDLGFFRDSPAIEVIGQARRHEVSLLGDLSLGAGAAVTQPAQHGHEGTMSLGQFRWQFFPVFCPLPHHGSILPGHEISSEVFR